jgi:hypothetical protein
MTRREWAAHGRHAVIVGQQDDPGFQSHPHNI